MILSHEFISKIIRSLQEEETDIFTLSLYSLNTDDLNYFNAKDREKVKRIFKVLSEDTKHHAELLKLIIDLGTK